MKEGKIKKSFYILLAISFQLIICCDKNPFENESDKLDLSEDRGTLITSISTNWLTLKWLNENELIASGFFGIQIINASNGAKRSIESRDAVFTFRVSNDSEKIFYILGGACSPSCSEDLYSIQANGQERTLIQDSIAFSPLSDNNISLSENGLFLAYKILDSLYIYNTINNTSEFQLDVAGFPISFSPDGNHLLYSTNSGYSILSIENRTSEEQEFDIGIGRIRKIRWDNEGIKAFFQGIPTNQYFVKNFSTNNQVKLWETNDTPYNSEFD